MRQHWHAVEVAVSVMTSALATAAFQPSSTVRWHLQSDAIAHSRLNQESTRFRSWVLRLDAL